MTLTSAAPGATLAATRGRRERKPVRAERHRDYPLSPAQAWRLLGDTDQMNRVIGLPAVDFSAADAAGGFVRRATAKLLGRIAVRWREYPFNWVAERGFSVRRDFESGPIVRGDIGLTIAPVAGGVRVTAYQEYVPASRLVRPFLRRFAAEGAQRMLAYGDRYLARREAGRADPLPTPARRANVERDLLDRLLERLGQTPVRSDLVPALRERILEGADPQVLRIRPYAVADIWGAERRDVLRLFLHATRVGLFELRWELMCPACRVPKGEVSTLAGLPDRFHCDTCGIDYESDFDRRVELRFSVHPAVRQARDDTYCIGSPVRTPHRVVQQILAPGEARGLALDLGQPLELRAIGGMGEVELAPIGTGTFSGRAQLESDLRSPSPSDTAGLLYREGRWFGESEAPGPPAQRVTLKRGPVVVSLRNASPGPVLAVLETAGWDDQAATAAEVTTLQEFRDLFSAEVLAPGQEVGVSHMALLFTDLKGSTSLYESVGDAPAYGRVNRHFDFLKERIGSRHGAVVKTIGDAVMGAFVSFGDAVGAALEIQGGVAAWCRARGIDPPLVLKAGVHHGPVIAVNANERLDYFGRTVNVAARLGAQSVGGDVVLLREAFEEPAARVAVEGRPLEVERFTARLRGIEGELDLVRLRPAD